MMEAVIHHVAPAAAMNRSNSADSTRGRRPTRSARSPPRPGPRLIRAYAIERDTASRLAISSGVNNGPGAVGTDAGSATVCLQVAVDGEPKRVSRLDDGASPAWQSGRNALGGGYC